jgi:transposase
VVYGPNINAAAVLLGSEGNVPAGRTAALMEALPGTPVSSGFVARALAQLAQRLQAAGFDKAMTDALHAEDVLCGDETVRHEASVRRTPRTATAFIPGSFAGTRR